MNKLLKILVATFSVVVVASCGGGGGSAGTSPFGSGTTTTTSSAASIDVLASAIEVGSSGDQVTITAIVKDPGNVSLPKAPVSFSTDSGTLTSAASVTDAAGVATAILSAGSNHSNRPLTVTVTSGSAVGSIVLPVTGTVLSYTGPTTVGLAKTVPITVKAVDSKGASIPGLAVSIVSSLNNGLSATLITTDAQGTASVDYTATNPGVDTLTLSGGGATVTPKPTIQISPDNFAFVNSASDFTALASGLSIPVGTMKQLFVRYLVNNAAQVGKTVQFTSTAGTVSSPTITDSNGVASIVVVSNTASPATVQGTITAGTITVQTSIPVLFVALAPNKLTLQVSPTAIGPNVGTSTAQQARLLATVVDANANPVAGATVNFSRVIDPSGGNLSQPSAVTDTSGQASVQYFSGASTTASNGVQVKAQVAGTAVFGTASMTVNQSALFIALGTGNTISNIDEQTYRKDWVVYVTDSNGVAVPNITLTIKVLPLLYGKGFLNYDGTSWVTAGTSFYCANEDDGGVPNVAANAYNGVLDPGEDRNHDGRLQPGNVISVTAAGGTGGASVGTFTTDSTGRSTISLIYAESYVPWVKVRLSAAAVVSGTESSTQSDFFVIGLASDFTSKTIPPAGFASPFGTATTSTNLNPTGDPTVKFPDGTIIPNANISPCQNPN
jgi:hypothetical protein